MPDAESQPDNVDPFVFLFGGGEMGERTRAFDWASTPVGPMAHWPQSLRTLVRTMLDSRYAMWLGWGSEFTFFYNDAYARMTLGPKHPWALGKPAREVWSEIWSDIGPRAESVIRTGQATWDEGLLLFLERQGFPEETYHTFSYSPVPDDRGDVGGMLCVVTEDTERTIGERRLRALRELAARTNDGAKSVEDACETATRTLVGSSHDLPFVALYLLSDDGQRARLVSRTGLEDATAFANEVDLDQSPWPFRQVADSGSAAVVDDLVARFGPLTGGAWPEPTQRAIVLPMAKPGQLRPTGFVVAGISPRLILNDGYRGFLDLLAGHIATAIANARAYEEERKRAEKLAELDRAKTAFFSNVSHEFRTPLTLMLGPVEDMLAKPEDQVLPDNRQLLSVVHRNGLRLQRLVNSLLDFSRIEAGRAQATYEPTDLAEFTTDLASNFRSACEKAGLKLLVHCESLGEPVFVDRQMYEKIVLNLLSNAFKFTFHGQITVSLRQLENTVELQVQDSGTGIPAAEMPRLFERFHRVENAQGRTHEGSGIGLALVQELVKLHGGWITAASEVGQGTTFTVSLPLGSQHLPHERVSSGRSAPPTASASSPFVEEALRWLPPADQSTSEAALPDSEGIVSAAVLRQGEDERPLVLVADDNVDMRRYVTRLLSDQYNVLAVADGEAAIAAVQREPPSLILSDVMMPHLDGFGLLHKLRADPRTAGVPVILLSARAGEESRVEGMEAGADDYLVKPFSARELLARVGAILQINRLRQQAEQAIRRSEERFRVLFDTMTEGFAIDEVIFDDEGRGCNLRYLEANPAFERHTGLKRKEVLGRTVLEIFPTAETQWFERYGNVVKTGIPTHFQAQFGPLNRWFEVSAYRAAPNQIATVFFDITEQKQAAERERELLLRERLRADELETVMAAVPAIVWIAHDPECRRITGNQASAELLRLPRQANQSVTAPRSEQPTHFKVMKDGVELSPAQLPVQLAATGVEVRDFEEEVVFDDGTRLHLFGHAMPLRDESGAVRGSVAAFVDITDRKRAEEAVRQSGERFRSMADNAPAMLWVTGADGKCNYLSRLWYEFTGRPLGSDIGFGWLGAVHPDDVASAEEIFNYANTQHISFRIDYRVRRHDGEYRWAVDAGLPRFEDGKFQGFVGCVFDVHERKIAEEANSLLVGSLRDADRRKDEFLATLAHELRNPLAPLRNGLQIMQLAKDEPQMAEQVREMMERQLAQLVHLVDDLLDLSRISRGKIELRRERIDLAKVVQHAVETSRPTIEEAKHDLLIKVPPEPIYVDADITRLAQVFSNLLNNAAKYTERGGRIQLAVQSQRSEVFVTVKDNGIGIPPQMLPFVFDMFTQVDRNLERSQGGLGIGLSIVKRLVEMHGGSVAAKSDGHAKGSEFVVRLPIARAAIAAASDNGEAAQPSGKRRILVVDDNRDAAVSLAMMLKLMGNETKTAHDGLEALGVAESYRPDLILLDIGMPRLNGYETAKRIRQRPWGEKIVLVALTGWGQEEDRRKSSEAGFDSHIVKPIEPGVLEKLLANHLPDRS